MRPKKIKINLTFKKCSNIYGVFSLIAKVRCVHFPKMVATTSPISLFSNVTKRWCLCPFPLKYGWARNSYAIEAAEWDHTTSKAKSEKAVQRLPCSLYRSHWSPQLHRGRHAGREPRHTERPHVGTPADRSVFKASQGSDTWAKEASGCSSPQAVESPPDFKSSQLRCEMWWGKTKLSLLWPVQILDP